MLHPWTATPQNFAQWFASAAGTRDLLKWHIYGHRVASHLPTEEAMFPYHLLEDAVGNDRIQSAHRIIQ